MKGKEIVLCNKDEPTTKEIQEKFEKIFFDKKEEEKYEHSSQEEIPSSDNESSMEVQSKYITQTNNQ
jgi:hypothetical protein